MRAPGWCADPSKELRDQLPFHSVSIIVIAECNARRCSESEAVRAQSGMVLVEVYTVGECAMRRLLTEPELTSPHSRAPHSVSVSGFRHEIR